MIVLGAAAPETGRVWASPLTGTPGFVRATGPRRMHVAGGVRPGDPLESALATEDTPVGTIALDPRTRRRMRLNGRLRPTAYAVMAGREPGVPRHGAELAPEQKEFIAGADTFFLATVHGDGAEVGHRGGNAGFVQVNSGSGLSWRDYPGNAMFLTLGHLQADPRAGLLFLDWTTGTALRLTGEARTEFDTEGEREAGARRVRFTLAEAVETPSTVPLRWSAPEYSPANPTPAF